MWIDITWILTVSSQSWKADGASTNVVLISTSAILTENVVTWTTFCYGMGKISHNILNILFSYVEIYEKWFHVQFNNPHSTAMAFNLFLERRPTEKFQPMISVARGTPLFTQLHRKMKNYCRSSHFCNFYLLSLSFFFLFFKSWKWCKVPQCMVTSETEMLKLLVQVAPSCGYLDQQGFLKTTGHIAT